MAAVHKSGFVNIFGAPNAGKSTLLNALLGEQLVITSPKVQTTRHRILGILTEPEYQLIFSDTPGIVEPKYKLHNKMMLHVKSALEDADVALLVHDIAQPIEEMEAIAEMLRLKVPTILLLNKIDTVKDKKEIEARIKLFQEKFPKWEVMPVSASKKKNIEKIIPAVLKHMPEAPPYYPEDSISDRSVRFFVSELIREQIYNLYHEEIPYHSAVIIQSFEEKPTLNVIKAEIIVSRETQKVIMIGKGGSMIKQLGINARKKIEEFLEAKVHLELFIKVRPKWRDNENYLREYGYN
ncbi:GTPase Era [Taibaiella soli]|uniref:GTPase Era n=1 Tax=Taibaiella soli TaxID=1649169 RepID=A0A2W2AKE5_9BACT|nr:GTPase Era [Taibaiella soli]PZF72730.1 GTPase Era [Taibaiella soli]